MNEIVEVILPLPSRRLSPNCPTASIGSRMAKAATAKKYRNDTKKAITEQQIESGPWNKCTVQAKFYYAMKRRRDQDNAMAMLKSAYDGIVDAMLVVDDDYEHMERVSPVFGVDKESPRLELIITRIE